MGVRSVAWGPFVDLEVILCGLNHKTKMAQTGLFSSSFSLMLLNFHCLSKEDTNNKHYTFRDFYSRADFDPPI